MWLTSSSIGRKFVMAITGIALVLFVTFHCLMNTVAIVWPTAYNVICEFLGANWYALIASAGLAVLLILHIIYASWLTITNRKARGNDRYLVTSRPPEVEWSSRNMYVLGIVIVAFLVVHLIQFWAKMQWQEIIGHEWSENGITFAPQFGTLFLQAAFKEVFTPIVYIIGFVALWFHLNHGIWSMMHSVGWDNNIWIKRLKCIALWWTTIVVGLFIAQAIVFTVKAHNDDFLNDPKLQEQYAEHYEQASIELFGTLNEDLAPYIEQYQSGQIGQMEIQDAQENVINAHADEIIGISNAAEVLCPKSNTPAVEQVKRMASGLKAKIQAGSPAAAPVEQVEVESEEIVVAEDAPADQPIQ